MASDSESARTYYHYACDSLGSVDYVLAGNEFECDEYNGGIEKRVLCRYEYDAFENVSNRYGFAGEIRDDVTGMYYLRARYYSCSIGRFTQADTYHGDGLNLYVYAGNNPVRYVDPGGHWCKDNGLDKDDSNSEIKAEDINWKGFSSKKDQETGFSKLQSHYKKYVIERGEFGQISQNDYLKMSKKFAKEINPNFQQKQVKKLYFVW